MQGLTSAEAAARLERDGPNTLPEPERSVWQVVLRQLDDVLVWLLIGALVLSTVLPFVEHGGWPGWRAFVDAAVIGAILVLNLVLGVVQVFRAERAIAALSKLAAPEVTVRRDGREQRLASSSVVVGDVVLLEAGERVPADARVGSASFLEVDESLLTGESLPVAKRPGEVDVDAPVAERPTMVHAGSLVTRGTAEVEVSATGARSAAGRIAGLMAAAEAPETPLERQLECLGKVLGLSALAVCLVVAALGWYREMPLVELLLVGISLAVSAVPEGLPAIVTVCFAAGMRHMSGRKALVRRLDALETLGAVTVIATDKTGTLTANEMTVVEHWGPDHLLALIGASCNHALAGVGDPAEQALLGFAEAKGVERLPIDEELVPFTSEGRCMATRHGGRVFWKGAPERLLELAGDDVEVVRQAGAMAVRGRRVLAAAEGPEGSLRIVGLWGLEDPPRAGVEDAVQAARVAGIGTLMVTGDHLDTARAIASRVGISGGAIHGSELDGLSAGQVLRRIEGIGVVARAAPEHKVALCEALLADGQVVAMTGDGVNDAPALRTSHVGVAMGGRGTEVAREAAAIVLADDHYATIVAAVAEGRRIHDNIRRFVLFLLRANFDELALILAALVLGLPIPYLPVHILWMNLLTDGLPALALSAEPAEPDVMERPPRPPDEQLLSGEWGTLAWATVICFAATFGYYRWQLDGGVSLDEARTGTLSLALLIELLLAYSSRSRGPVWRIPPLGNPWLLAACSGVAALHLVLVYTSLGGLLHLVPLRAAAWGPIAGIAAGVFVLYELSKVVRGSMGAVSSAGGVGSWGQEDE